MIFRVLKWLNKYGGNYAGLTITNYNYTKFTHIYFFNTDSNETTSFEFSIKTTIRFFFRFPTYICFTVFN